jgi:hypothetical protein
MDNKSKNMKKRTGTSRLIRKDNTCRWFSFIVMIALYTILLLSFGGGVIFCDQKWQGNAAMIRRGEFESAGMYSASNSFPLNSKIFVRNLRNNRAVEVIVIQRIPEGMNVFLLLSEEAARQLGMGENDVINVEVSVISFGTGDIIGLPDDLPYNPDIDVYPCVTDEPGVTPFVTPIYTLEPTPEPLPEVTETPAPEVTETPAPEVTETPAPEVTETPVPEITGEPTPEVTQEAVIETTFEPTPEPSPVPESAERQPQKNLFLPPHEDERYVLVDITKPEGENGTDEVVYQPADADIAIKEEEGAETSLVTPESTEGDLAIKDIDSPLVENPVVEDRKISGKEEEEITLAEADLPVVPEKEIGAPDPSTEVPEMKEADIALVQEEPQPPAQKEKDIPDPSNEVPGAEEKEIAFVEKEPDVPREKEKDIPDPSNEVPGAEEKEIAFVEKEPDVPREKEKVVPDPSHETPTADGEEETIALITKEPVLPEEEEEIEPDGIREYEEEVEITLEETGPSPPPAGDDREIKEIVEDSSYRIDTRETESLVPGYYFIQLGAYAEKQLADSIEKKFTSIYPIKVYEIKHTKITIYKVLVGPLNKDESDTLLYRFKALGYRDAFVKYIN